MTMEKIKFTNSKGKEKIVTFDSNNMNHQWARSFFNDMGSEAVAFGMRGNTTYKYIPEPAATE